MKDSERPAQGRSGETARSENELPVPRPVWRMVTVSVSLTLLTGLLFFFAWSYTVRYFGHFGVDSSVLTLPIGGGLLRRIGDLVVPVLVITGCVLATVTVLSVLLRRALLSQGRSNRAVAGLAVIAVAAAAGLVWTAHLYATAVADERASEDLSALPERPGAVLHSDRPLNIDAPGVIKTKCPDTKYPYRYEGIKLIRHSRGVYLFLPEAWKGRDGAAFAVPTRKALRVELGVSSAGSDC